MAKKFSIFNWMVAGLGLSGNELVTYAFLYESTKGGMKVFEDGYTVISAAIGTTIPTVYNTLKKLQERGHISVSGDGRSGVMEVSVTKVKRC